MAVLVGWGGGGGFQEEICSMVWCLHRSSIWSWRAKEPLLSTISPSPRAAEMKLPVPWAVDQAAVWGCEWWKTERRQLPPPPPTPLSCVFFHSTLNPLPAAKDSELPTVSASNSNCPLTNFKPLGSPGNGLLTWIPPNVPPPLLLLWFSSIWGDLLLLLLILLLSWPFFFFLFFPQNQNLRSFLPLNSSWKIKRWDCWYQSIHPNSSSCLLARLQFSPPWIQASLSLSPIPFFFFFFFVFFKMRMESSTAANTSFFKVRFESLI